MKFTPRLLMSLMLAVVVLVFVPADAHAQGYPSKPINIITPFPTGGPNDILSRILGRKLTENWGQPVVVNSRGGGNTVIGTEMAAKAPADGYTLFMGQPASMTIVPALYRYGSSKALPYDTMKDFTPVTFIGVGPLILGVHPVLPAKSVKELIALAKSRPGKLNYNSSGSGGTTHLSMELFKNIAGVDIVHIPYTGGGNQVMAIMSGHVDLGFASITNTLPQVKVGKIRALAIGTSRRSPAAPDLPTVAEAGLSGFGVDPWFGVLAPTGTPRDIISKLNTEFTKYLLDPKVIEQINSLGIDVISKPPEQFAKFLAEEAAMWNRVVKASGAKVD